MHRNLTVQLPQHANSFIHSLSRQIQQSNSPTIEVEGKIGRMTPTRHGKSYFQSTVTQSEFAALRQHMEKRISKYGLGRRVDDTCDRFYRTRNHGLIRATQSGYQSPSLIINKLKLFHADLSSPRTPTSHQHDTNPYDFRVTVSDEVPTNQVDTTHMQLDSTRHKFRISYIHAKWQLDTTIARTVTPRGETRISHEVELEWKFQHGCNVTDEARRFLTTMEHVVRLINKIS
jgi:hypothetical protein